MRSSPWLASLPVTRPFLDEGGHAFLLVLGAEQTVEQAALEADPLAERDLERRVDHLLDRDRGNRRHGGNRLRRLERFVEQLAGWHHLRDEAGALCFLRAH